MTPTPSKRPTITASAGFKKPGDEKHLHIRGSGAIDTPHLLGVEIKVGSVIHLVATASSGACRPLCYVGNRVFVAADGSSAFTFSDLVRSDMPAHWSVDCEEARKELEE